MSRFHRTLCAAVVLAVFGVAIPFLAGAAGSPQLVTSATSEPDGSTPVTSEPHGSPARQRWLESTDGADPDSFAGGAPLRQLVDGRRVLMIGDSIMASTSRSYGGEMCNELVPRGWEVEVDAESGRFVDFGERVLDARLDAGWDVAVVMLGNNYGSDQAVYEEHLHHIVERLSPRPTVLLTVTEFRDDRQDVNETIYEVAADFDNVGVVDWASETSDAPELVGGDGLHLSDAGRVRYADLVGRRLGRAPGSGEGECLGSDYTDDSAVTDPGGTVQGQVVPPTTPTNGGGDDDTGGDDGGGGGVGGGATTVPPPATEAPDDGGGDGGGGGTQPPEPTPTTAAPPPPSAPPPPPPPTTSPPTAPPPQPSTTVP